MKRALIPRAAAWSVNRAARQNADRGGAVVAQVVDAGPGTGGRVTAPDGLIGVVDEVVTRDDGLQAAGPAHDLVRRDNQTGQSAVVAPARKPTSPKLLKAAHGG
jgi:hypothetical protein